MNLCRIQDALSRVESCPGDACPFWQAGDGDGRYAFGHLEIADNPSLATWLVEIRTQLDTVRSPDEGDPPHRLFYRLAAS